VLDRVHAERDRLAHERSHDVQCEPAALRVDGVGDPRDQLGRIADPRCQRVELARREVADDLHPRPAGPDALPRRRHRLVGRCAVVERWDEEVRGREERAAADRARGHADAGQRAGVTDRQHARAAVLREMRSDELVALEAQPRACLEREVHVRVDEPGRHERPRQVLRAVHRLAP
jgi:hypothetical protein